MKIVHAIGWYFPTSTGGSEIYVRAITRHQRGAGLDVKVVAPSPGTEHPTTYVDDEVPVYRYPIPADATRSEVRGETMVRGAEHLHAWFARERPDVVHFHTVTTGLDFGEMQAAHAAGARVFFTAHTSALGYLCARGSLMRWGTSPCDGMTSPVLCSACMLQQRGLPRAAAYLLGSLPQRIARTCDAIPHAIGTVTGMAAYIARRRHLQDAMFEVVDRFFVLTAWGQRALIARGAPSHKVVLNRLGVQHPGDHLRPAVRNSRGLRVGFLARLDPVKGLGTLLGAVEALRGVELTVDVRGIPNPDFPGVVAELQRAMAGDSRIRFNGAVSHADVPELLATWDVLVCPGLSLEGGPTVALEALAVGTPVITSNVGGVAELLADGVNTRLVAPGDWQALAGVLRDLSVRPELLAEWRTKLPRPRTMTDVAEQYLAAYLAA
jgi:glycosyltransferase involved in cell wall biosynthesis